MRDGHVQGGLVALQTVPGDVDGPLDAALPRGELGEIGKLLLVELPDPVAKAPLVGDVHEDAVEILLLAPLPEELRLDGDPLDGAAPADDPVLQLDGIPPQKLLLQQGGRRGEIVRVDHRGHPVPHGREFLAGVADELKQAVVGLDHREIRVGPAAEDRARDVVVKAQDLLLRLPLRGDVDADRRDRGASVLRDRPAPRVVDPYVGAVLLFHPVLDDVFSLFRELGLHLLVHHPAVVRVHAVGDQPADIGHEVRLALIAEVTEHLAVDEVEGEALLDVPAHHAAQQRIVEQLLPLPGDLLHHQGLGVVLLPPLAAARLREMQAAHQPGLAVLPHEGAEDAKPPGVLRILQGHLRGQAADMLRRHLLVERLQHAGEGLPELPHVRPQVGGHLLFPAGQLVFSRAHEIHRVGQKPDRRLRVPPFEPVAAERLHGPHGRPPITHIPYPFHRQHFPLPSAFAR